MIYKRRLRRLVRSVIKRLPVVGAHWDAAWRRRWLLNMMPPESVCAEIGVWQGDFSAQIMAVAGPRRLHLIDPWLATDEHYPGALSATDQRRMERVHNAVLERFARATKDGTVVVHRARSADAARNIPDESLDWVYIDGDHQYEAVRADIATYSRKVRPGGFVCGDDYDGRGFPGVKRAVDEAVADGRLILVVQRRRQFILLKPLPFTARRNDPPI